MLSTVVQGVSGVLFLGHVVVAVTLLVLLRSTGPALAQRHATALEHAAMGSKVEARLAQRAEPPSDTTHAEGDGTSPSEGEAPDGEPVPEQDPVALADDGDDIIEVLD